MDTGQIKSLENGRNLNQFHIVAFSLSYELDFLNILKILRTVNIPPYSERRTGLPILILGGVAAFANPLPYSPFFDLICIGEAEEVLYDLINLFKKNPQKEVFLADAYQNIEGVWIPRFGKKKVKRVWVRDLNEIDTSAGCVSPFSHFKNMQLVEVERGCPFNCRFCLATKAYSPYRVKNSTRIYEEIARSGMNAEKVGLIGAAISEVPDLPWLIEKLSGTAGSIGISSLRLDRVEPELLKILVEKGLKKITVAPEAGTERLRKIINKPIKDEKILQLGAISESLGVKRLKLYFMIGLPFETEDDLVGIIDLIRRFKSVYRGKLVVSINPFVPKPHTPFQYHPMEDTKTLRHKISFVTRELKKIRVKLVTKSPREAILQAALSTGDSLIGEELLSMVNSGVGLNSYLSGISSDSPLPWEFIDFGVDSKELLKSYNEAKKLSLI